MRRFLVVLIGVVSGIPGLPLTGQTVIPDEPTCPRCRIQVDVVGPPR